ncbi:Mitochondrial matrix iron chaperone [Marasmius tenuissimus]|nr:Mitochondrial matrix iron chaperone [Marasmius tenuissimus]
MFIHGVYSEDAGARLDFEPASLCRLISSLVWPYLPVIQQSLTNNIPTFHSQKYAQPSPNTILCNTTPTAQCQVRTALGIPPGLNKEIETLEFNSSLSVEEYHELSDEVMDTLVEDLESLIDEHGNPSYEVEYHSGVLTLKLGEEGTYVINKQPPNKQIWLSSPVSGPKRYDYSQPEDSWTYSRDKRSLGQLLNEELSKAFKKNIKLNIP